MSFSVYGNIDNGEVKTQQANNVESAEAREVVRFSTELLTRAVADGLLGAADGRYSFSISGHANPDHLPVEGWSNDHLNITITQVSG